MNGFPARFRVSLFLCLMIVVSGLSIRRAGAASYSQKVLDTRPGALLAYWALNETSGTTATDSSGNGNHGTYVGVVLNGYIHLDGLSAPSFDGISDWVSIPDSPTLNPSGAMTISAWVNAEDTEYWRGIVSKSDAGTWADGYGLFFSADDVLTGYGQGGYGGGQSINFSVTGQWVHFAYTWDGAIQRLYQNGTLLASSGRSAGSPSAETLYLGLQGGGRSWYGAIARVAIWDEALDDDEIISLSSVVGGAPVTAVPPAFSQAVTLSGGRDAAFIYSASAGDFIIVLVGLIQVGFLIAVVFLLMRGRR